MERIVENKVHRCYVVSENNALVSFVRGGCARALFFILTLVADWYSNYVGFASPAG